MLCMGFGWTWEYVDEFMTLPRLNGILKYWGKQPPLFLMVGWYLGIGDKDRGVKKAKDMTDSEKAEFMDKLAMIGG